ncbi:MAG TPA: type II secretion system protein [Candidatus Dormibacteraeota bacterium]|jgi:prepilin-type N-terminal cleavage/methylation domain-containing protein|nr:type II secretion system protein [Candidatus Dormibacteraeota bacterium]
MILKALKRLHKDQRGFTLIEVLVVMTILGILAAIVSISLLGITASAREKARAAELQNVQSAMDAMLADQQVPHKDIAGYCGGGPTGSFTAFPPGAGVQTYSNPDSGKAVFLATHYLRDDHTSSGATYSCDADGKVVQH